jgi:Beta-lactamase
MHWHWFSTWPTARRRRAVVAACGALALLGAQAAPEGALAAYTPMPGDPLAGSGNVTRTLITSSDLQTLNSPAAAVDNAAFTLPANAAPPSHQFQGRLVLSQESTRGGFNRLVDTVGYTNNSADSPWKHVPHVDMEFVQNGSYLIPTYEGLLVTGSLNWNAIVGTGRAWDESGDGGWTRASVPFDLVERNQNCTHAGLMTFLFNGSSVSNVRYQVTHETCMYFQFDMWGELPAAYVATAPANADAIRSNKSAEVSNRLPVKSISELPADYPNSGANFSAFGGGVTPAAMSEYGLLIADPTNAGRLTNYVSTCGTRHGDDPFCDERRLPSYSTAKTSFAGLAFMRLVEQGGSAVRNLNIGNYLPGWTLYAPWARWNSVTFKDAVELATGHYRSAADIGVWFADENSWYENQYLTAETDTAKFSTALEYWPYQPSGAPGTTFVYHSHDMFLATRAMQTYAGTDLFNKVRDDVYKPLELSAGFMTSLRTGNTSNNTSTLGQALGSHGLFYNRDDIAKLAKLLNNDHGVINNVQVLSPSELNAAMQRDPNDRGVATNGTIINQRYNDGIWGKQMTRAEFPNSGYGCDFWVPRMSGYGGIVVLMMPNGATYWYFSDNNEFAWYDAIQAANKLKSMC